MPWYCNIEKDTQERSLERSNLAHYKMQCNIIERAVCQGAHPEVLRRVSHTGQSPSPWPSTISCAQAMPATRGVCKAALVRALRIAGSSQEWWKRVSNERTEHVAAFRHHRVVCRIRERRPALVAPQRARAAGTRAFCAIVLRHSSCCAELRISPFSSHISNGR